MRKVAPLGDPIEITVRGYELSIRKADAELIEVAFIWLLFRPYKEATTLKLKNKLVA